MGEKRKKALKVSTGRGHFSENTSLVGGVTHKNHQFTALRPAGSWQTPAAEILIWMVHGCQSFGITFPKFLGD